MKTSTGIVTGCFDGETEGTEDFELPKEKRADSKARETGGGTETTFRHQHSSSQLEG